VSHSVIAKRYGKALVELGLEHGRLEEVRQELDRLSEAFAVEPRLGLLLQSPSLAAGTKRALLEDVADYLELSGLLRNFAGLLQSKERLRQLPAIARAFAEQADDALGVQRAQVQSAFPLSEEERRQLKEILEQRSGRQVVLEEQSDPELLGGIKVVLGGQILDGSLRTQLDKMAEILNRG
jgi:F-type H+-transporting ATPase subunit delta